MTMVLKPRRPDAHTIRPHRAAAWMAVAALSLCWATAPLSAQAPRVHFQHSSVSPPGAIGSWQLRRGGPLPGYFQPVQIIAPPGALISLAAEGVFQEPSDRPVTAGMLIGSVYRLRIGNVPLAPGFDVFPTVEVIDRLYPRAELAWRYPIPIELTEEDLRLALRGKMITRVVYLEEPRNAVPHIDRTGDQRWFEAGPGEDPLHVADALGRPVAIVRMGGRVPTNPVEPGLDFLFGSPPWMPQPAGALSPTEGVPPGTETPAAATQPADDTPAVVPAAVLDSRLLTPPWREKVWR